MHENTHDSPQPVAASLLACVYRAAARLELPPVAHLHLPEQREKPGMESEFGLVVLDDGSAGLFFALLGDTLHRLHSELQHADTAGRSPLALARGIVDDDPVTRAVALGAISAISQHLFARVGYEPPDARNAMGGTGFTPGDHVGMVGLFPSLARRLREQGIPLTVLELRAEKVSREPGFEVTLDPGRLRGCNRILCTASTLINGTLDSVLASVADAEHVALIGPSASCFPDPLFARGIRAVGGARVVDSAALAQRLAQGEAWGNAVRRYVIEADAYPGLDTLLEQA
jgi:uncharacterized protein (DUF4213/DUF364 family)